MASSNPTIMGVFCRTHSVLFTIIINQFIFDQSTYNDNIDPHSI